MDRPRERDYLIAEGKPKPMIVVMPYGHVARAIKPGPGALPSQGDSILIEKELMTQVKPTVEANYRVLTDREHRAIGGLSMGAAQSLQIGLHNLDQFSYIAAFSRAAGTAGPTGRCIYRSTLRCCFSSSPHRRRGACQPLTRSVLL